MPRTSSSMYFWFSGNCRKLQCYCEMFNIEIWRHTCDKESPHRFACELVVRKKWKRCKGRLIPIDKVQSQVGSTSSEQTYSQLLHSHSENTGLETHEKVLLYVFHHVFSVGRCTLFRSRRAGKSNFNDACLF